MHIRLKSSCNVRYFFWIAAALVLILAICAAPPLRAAGNPAFSSPLNISNDGAGNFPQIIVDSSGNIDVAFADASPSFPPCTVRQPCTWTGILKFVRSTDGGKSFSPPIILTSTGAGPFRMALESECTIDMAYFEGADVLFAQSVDCGKSFTPAHVTSTGNMSPGVDMEMVVSGGVAQVAWQVGLTDPNVPKLYYTKGNAKNGFPTPSLLATQPSGVMGLIGMAMSKGTADILWWAGEFHFDVFLSLNGGAPTSVAAGAIGTGPFFSVDPAGNVDVAWEEHDDVNGNNVIHFVRANGQTGAFGSVQTVAIGAVPGIAADPQGNIGLAWGVFSVVFSRSKDGGTTFSAPVTVGPAMSGSVSLPPQIVLPNTSFAGVAWVQGSDLWFNSSSDSGSTFSSPTNITNNQSSPSALQIITDSPGDVLMVWSENDAKGHDVFFARSGMTQSTSGGISGSVAPTSATIAVGASATFDVSLKSTGGFAGTVDLACGGAPSGVNCSFAPSHVGLAADGTASSALTVQVSAKPSLVPPNGMSRNAPLLTSPSIFAKLAQGIAPNARLAVFLLAFLSALLAVILGGRDSQRTLNLPAWLRWRAKSLSFSNWVTERFFITCRGRVLTMPSSLAALVLVLVLAAGLLSCGGTTSKSTSTTVAGTAGTTGTTGTGGMGGAGGTSGMGGSGGSGGSGGGTGGGTSGSGSSVTVQLTVQAQSAGATTNLGTVSITVP